MFVRLGFQIDVVLRAAQRFEVALDLIKIGVLGDQMPDHERGIDDFFETQLFGDIKWRAEEARGGDLAVDEQRQAVEQADRRSAT